jgi:hypothetical protein
MDPFVTQGVGNLLSGIVNNLFSFARQRRTFRENQRMSKMAYAHDLDMWNRKNEWDMRMWNMQNEYNLPAKQMQRLRDAGLNPNLIYGNAAAGGQAAQVRSGEIPRYQAPRADFSFEPVAMPNLLGMYQDFRLRSAQTDNVRAQADLARQRSLTETAIRDPKTNKMITDAQSSYAKAMYSTQAEDLRVRTAQRQLENLLLDWQIKAELLGRTKAEKGIRQKELDWMSGFTGARPQDIVRTLEQFLRMALTNRK